MTSIGRNSLGRFAFIVEGPPVSVNAKDKNPKRYQKWIRTVHEAARQSWPKEENLRWGDVVVEITNYFTSPPLDVDNVIKPVLDGLCLMVFEDDSQVQKVISQRAYAKDIVNPEPEVADVLGLYNEFLFIVVTWEEED